MKRYLISGSLGISIGALISLLMSALFGEGTYFPVNPFSTMGEFYYQHLSPVTIMAISLAIWFTIGLLFQAADACFEQDWSLLKMSVTHFVISVTGFTALGCLAGWFPLDLLNLIVFWLIYCLIYAVLYWVNYRKMQENVRLINHSLDK